MIILAGWVKLHRQIQKHWLWHEKPFDKRSAWIDLILLANHSDNKFVLGNELISVNKGSFITSELKLMERWGWSKSKVRAFLKLLEKDNMIIKKTDKKKTTIIIENYSEYQETQTTKELQKDHKETTKEPQKDTNKNEEECSKNEEEIKNSCSKLSIDEFFEEVWKLLPGPSKKGKTKVSKKSKEAIYKVGYEKMAVAIENYKKDLIANPWKQPMYGSTLLNGRYEDFFESQEEEQQFNFL